MFSAIDKFIDRLEGVSMVAFMTIATSLTLVQVIYRYGFNNSIFWIEEVVIYSIICMSFVGASMGVRHGAHISVDILGSLLPAPFRRWLVVVSTLLGICFAAMLIYYGFELFLSALSRRQMTPALRLPMAWFYLPIGLSGLLLAQRYLRLLVLTWRGQSNAALRESDKLV